MLHGMIDSNSKFCFHTKITVILVRLWPGDTSPPAAGQWWASACWPGSCRGCPWSGPSWSQRHTFWLGGWSGMSWSPRYSIQTGCGSYPSPQQRPWTPRWENPPRRPNQWPGTDGKRICFTVETGQHFSKIQDKNNDKKQYKNLNLRYFFIFQSYSAALLPPCSFLWHFLLTCDLIQWLGTLQEKWSY